MQIANQHVDDAITDVNAEEKEEISNTMTRLTGFDIVNAFSTNLLNKLLVKSDSEAYVKNTYVYYYYVIDFII